MRKDVQMYIQLDWLGVRLVVNIGEGYIPVDINDRGDPVQGPRHARMWIGSTSGDLRAVAAAINKMADDIERRRIEGVDWISEVREIELPENA